MENIEYSHLVRNTRTDREMLDEIVDLLVETVCSARKSIRIAGDDSTAELVKTKLMKMDSSHIEFVIDCLRKNTTETPEIPAAEKFSYAFRSLFWLEFDNLAHLPADYAEKPYSDGDFTALNA